ncbi:MAG: hypothetical protein HKO65_07510, partial [Gemmatimonadetes bacterium]|nr:hypothetical protein [Gemmatimonadota bacterium]
MSRPSVKPMKSLPSRSARRNLIPILVVCSWTAACRGDAGRSPGPVVRDSAGVVIQEFPAGVLATPASIRLAEVPQVRIGVVEGTPEYQWTRPVAAARLSDGGFAVLEQFPAEVRVFDRSGRFLRRVGSEGDGPAEFRSPVGIAVLSGDTILVWDRGLQRLSWFSKEGVLEREQTVGQPGGVRTVRRVALSPSGAVLVLGATTTEVELGNQGRVRETWQVVRIAPNDDRSPVLGTVPGTERAIQVQGSGDGEIGSVNVQGRWWWGEGFAWASERGVWTADQLSLEARHFDLDSGLDRVVRILAPDRPFTSALIDSLHHVELERVWDPELRDLWQADFEGRQYPQRVPPVAGVFSDMAARVWIGLTDPPPERLPSGELTAIRRWLVFEQHVPEQRGHAMNYRALGLLTLPPRSHPLWADVD